MCLISYFVVYCPADAEPENVTLQPTEGKCDGLLVVTHLNTASLGDYRKIYLSEKNEYLNLKKRFRILKKNIIINIEAKGNCCWELFPRPKYVGKQKQEINPNKTYLPTFQAKSAKKKKCNN